MDEQIRAELAQLDRDELIEMALRLQDEIEQNKKEIARRRKEIAESEALFEQRKAIMDQLDGEVERLKYSIYLWERLQEFFAEERRQLLRRYGVPGSGRQ